MLHSSRGDASETDRSYKRDTAEFSSAFVLGSAPLMSGSMQIARDTSPASSEPVDESIRLHWPGRQWVPGAWQSLQSSRDSAGLETVEVIGDGAQRVVQADALAFAEALRGEGMQGRVDLVYVDPPYASERDYVAESRLDGRADGRVVRTLAYADTWETRAGGLGRYLDMLAPRLEALASLLAPTGTMWVQLDWRASYLARVILDEIFGKEAFINEIVWRRAPNLGRQAASAQFGRTLDTLLVYGNRQAALVPPTRLEPIDPASIRCDEQGRRFTTAPRGDYTDASIAKLEAEGRVYRTSNGKAYIKYFLVQDARGAWCRERRVDALWTDVAPLRHAPPAERTGYPTQKPRQLLERIVACASRPGGWVVDAFAGSGTTAVAAHALGRRAIIADRSPLAVATARARLLREGAGVTIEQSRPTPSPHVNGAPDDSADGVLQSTPTQAPGIGVRVSHRRGPENTLHVTLVEPSELSAWAIGTQQQGVFCTLWHAERVLGAKRNILLREAEIVIAVGQVEQLFVRVWSDDGSVATRAMGEVST